MSSFADIEVTTIDGAPRKIGDYAGKVLLIVNVASKCGFTPQYAGLEALERRFSARGFEVLGFPCDQFGHQEPGDEAEIKSFCALKYDVTFPMFGKIEVNGDGAHPLYPLSEETGPRPARHRGDQMEFHQISGGPGRQGPETLRPDRQAGGPCGRY